MLTFDMIIEIVLIFFKSGPIDPTYVAQIFFI